MLELRGHSGPVRCVGYSPDSRWLASGSEDVMVIVWDFARGAEHRLLAVESGVEALAFLPRGHTLAVGTARGDLELWDAGRGERWATVAAHPEGVRSVACLAEGNLLVMCGWDRTLKCWDAATLADRTAFPAPPGPVTVFACTSRGDCLAAGKALNGRLWLYTPAHSWRVIDDVPAGPPLTAATFSPEGTVLAVGSADGIVRLVGSAAECLGQPLVGHTGPVFAVGFTPDGRTLLSAGADGTVRVWDVAGGRERRAYRWHTKWVTSLAVAPDGMTAAAGGEDQTIVVWDVGDGD